MFSERTKSPLENTFALKVGFWLASFCVPLLTFLESDLFVNMPSFWSKAMGLPVHQ
jgi:hypothetical protein